MIALSEILKGIEPLRITGDTSRLVRDIQYDSRKIEPEHAFVAIKGQRSDGHDFIEQAYQKGARTFFVEKPVQLPSATVIQLADCRRSLAKISQIFFNHVDRKLKLTGITGTNGKTTTAYLIYSILKKAHWRPGLISTIEYFDGLDWNRAERTTPESLDLFRMFRKMVNHGLKSAVMEVSSHALELHRVDNLRFGAAVFTNLGRDHLDFHRTKERYFSAKSKLFRNLTENQKAVLNLDDPVTKRIINKTEGEVFTFSFKNPGATVRHLNHRVQPKGMVVSLQIPSGELILETPLLGRHNIYNLMAAVTTAVALGLNDNFISEGIREMKAVPGRCEHYNSPEEFAIFIDYAHTPEALQNFLGAVLESSPGQIIVVFGAGGDRDKGKRSQMGHAAEDFADRIILTNDNPRSEEPRQIMDDILKGIFDKDKVEIIPDRREAIREALKIAGKGDAVVIAGKGHENYQEFKGNRIPFDDREVLKEYFDEMGWKPGIPIS